MIDLKNILDKDAKFINFNRVVGNPDILTDIAQAMRPLIMDMDPDMLIGNEKTAQGILAVMALNTGIPSRFVVSKCKPLAGKMRYFDDAYEKYKTKGLKAVIIEPVITDNWSPKRLKCACKSRQIQIVGIIAVVDLRAEKDTVLHNYPFFSLVRKKEWLNLGAKP